MGNNGTLIVAAFIVLVFGGLLISGGQGVPGVDGLDGLDGAAGVKGDPGIQGLPGVNGVDGAAGAQGIQGLRGFNGTQGIQGEPGVDGVDGEDGAAGAKGDKGDKGDAGDDSTLKAYTLHVQALTSSPGDSVTRYFGNLPKAPVSAAATSKIHIPRNGTIVAAVIYCYSGTAGTNENLSLYIRKNDAADTLIKTVGANTNERVFDNYALNIPVVQGDYFEIKCVHPLWATNPLTTIFGGYVYVE